MVIKLLAFCLIQNDPAFSKIYSQCACMASDTLVGIQHEKKQLLCNNYEYVLLLHNFSTRHIFIIAETTTAKYSSNLSLHLA